MVLDRRERLNLGLVAVFSQALQITFVAVAVFAFFTLFGYLAIPPETVAFWTQSRRTCCSGRAAS